MQGYQKIFLGPDGTVADAIRILEEGGIQICLVVDHSKRLVGTVTDGDVRRGILRSLRLDSPVAEIMKMNPVFGHPDDDAQTLLAAMSLAEIRQLPLCDGQRRVVGMVTERELLNQPAERENWVVLMAGGLGQRLRPLTDTVPKPLLKVGQKPLLETILETFLSQGFRRFYLSVNYKAEMVRDHFGTGERWGCTIRYLQESRRMGTAGALSLIEEPLEKPMIVMNGDLLTKVNFANLLDFHAEQNAFATMCVREFDLQVPYGVVEIDEGRITGLVEKPIHTFFVNAGIYVVDPAAQALVPHDQAFDMTDLFTRIMADGHNSAAFPIREYWLDIGRPDDFAKANGEFAQIFE